ncbi:hypothetical protein AMELA_G00233310 [Ameiurus melas]|uniref:Secreted protein n=1 Tax=Ameiurus melas TaxID=219545 RepID=A0A7J5ZXF9_AMEME|nr:hypothetical protein AMELA_G00233310 [Ameiurus melas]
MHMMGAAVPVRIILALVCGVALGRKQDASSDLSGIFRARCAARCLSLHSARIAHAPTHFQLYPLIFVLGSWPRAKEGNPALCSQIPKGKEENKKNFSKPKDVSPEASTRDVIPSEPSCLRTRSAEAHHIGVAYHTSLSVWFSDLGNVIENGRDARWGREKKGHCSSNNSQCS